MTTVTERVRRAADPWVPEGTTRGQLVTVAALVLVAAQLAFRAWAVFGGWFYADDLIFLADVARGDASIAWLFQPHDSQFMPVGLLVAKVVGSAGAYAWPVAATSLVLLQAGASLACWLVLRVLFGNRPMILVPLAFYLFTTMTVPSLMWWAAALNQLPLQIALFLAVAAHVRWLRSPTASRLLLTSGCLVLGYLSYVKSVGIPVVLLLVTVLWFVPRGTRVLTVLWRTRVTWVAQLLLTAGFGVYYVLNVPAPLQNSSSISYGELAWALVGRSMSTGVLGGPWWWDALNPPLSRAEPPTGVSLAACAVVVTVVALALVWRRHAWRALVVPVVWIGFTYYLLATGRAISLGAFVGLEWRYLGDTAAVLALSVGLGTMRLLGAARQVGPRRVGDVWARLLRPVAAVLGVLAVAGSAWSTVAYVRPWHEPYGPRTFVGAVAERTDAGGPIDVADGAVPRSVMPGTAYPYNLPSRLLSPFGDRVRVVDSGTDLLLLGEGGAAGQIILATTATTATGPRPGCGYPVDADEPTTIDLSDSTNGFERWVAVNYLGSTAGRMSVTAGDQELTAPVVPGLHRFLFRTTGTYDSVTVRAGGPGQTVCVDKIEVGDLPTVE